MLTSLISIHLSTIPTSSHQAVSPIFYFLCLSWVLGSSASLTSAGLHHAHNQSRPSCPTSTVLNHRSQESLGYCSRYSFNILFLADYKYWFAELGAKDKDSSLKHLNEHSRRQRTFCYSFMLSVRWGLDFSHSKTQNVNALKWKEG